MFDTNKIHLLALEFQSQHSSVKYDRAMISILSWYHTTSSWVPFPVLWCFCISSMPVCICSTLPTYMRRRSYLGDKSEHRGEKCSTTGLRVIRNLAWLHNIKDTSARLCSLVKRPDNPRFISSLQYCLIILCFLLKDYRSTENDRHKCHIALFSCLFLNIL